MPMPECDRIGNYRIEGMLGRGAVGVVYRALDHRSGQAVALKTIHLDLFSDEERDPIVARLQREAEIGMRLDHPGVVKVLDFETTDDIAALAMELVDGENLAQYSGGAGLEWRAAVTWTRQLLTALSYVHNRGVIHRDVKPANIIAPRAGKGGIKLTDFGIAHIAISTLTCAGDVVGTPAYMSPEQLQGHAIDERADIFSAGATLYALVAGRPPFSGPLASVMQQLLYQPVPALSAVRDGIPGSLDAIVCRAMAKDPTARFLSAREFIAALDAAIHQAPGIRHFVQASSDDTVLRPRRKATSGTNEAFEALANLLDAAASAPVTEKQLARARSLCAALTAASMTSSERSRAIDICVTKGLVPLAGIALEAAPLPHHRGVSPRADFIALTTLIGICRRLLLHLGANGDPSVQQLAARLQEAVASFAASLSESLAAEDNPDVAAISAKFMRLDVLDLGLEMLGANEERRSLAATEALLVNQVMARVNATFRRYAQTRDMFVRFELAVFLTEIEELIVLAERLVDRSTDVASAFHAMGRQTLTEFVRHTGILAQSIIDELLQELTAAERRRIPAFGGRIKQLGLIYIFATRFDEPAIRMPLHDLSTKLYRLMEKLAGEVVLRLKAALVRNQVSEIRDHVEQIAAMHELAREVGWDELSGRLLAEIRNHVVADPALRNLFVAGAA